MSSDEVTARYHRKELFSKNIPGLLSKYDQNIEAKSEEYYYGDEIREKYFIALAIINIYLPTLQKSRMIEPVPDKPVLTL